LEVFIHGRLVVAFQSIGLLFAVFVFEVCFDQLFYLVLSDTALSLLETTDNNEYKKKR